MSGWSDASSFRVESSTGGYQVLVGRGRFEETLRGLGDACILADEFFSSAVAGAVAEPILIRANEEAKSLHVLPSVIERLRALGATRSTRLVAIGGGVVQDIAAFTASIYMRGIGWSYDPTTVLGMVDSCIGGKSSINVGPYKNLVGTFHPPDTIHIDPLLALTLPRDQFASGMVEAAKICFCRGPEAFGRYLAHGPSLAMDAGALEAVILESLHAKKHFIEIDEFDQKERLLLNFGHTFGHALEGASHYGIPHGIAVGLGIVCSLNFQRQRDVRCDDVQSVRELERHLDGLIRTLPELRTLLLSLDLNDVMDRFASDKKHTREQFTVIVIAADGRVVLERIAREPATTLGLRRAIELTIEGYTQ